MYSRRHFISSVAALARAPIPVVAAPSSARVEWSGWNTFERLLELTRANLVDGDLSSWLMAWKWGRRKDGGWGVMDPNAASDADLWLAYVVEFPGENHGDHV